jgi:hypothetical protein
MRMRFREIVMSSSSLARVRTLTSVDGVACSSQDHELPFHVQEPAHHELAFHVHDHERSLHQPFCHQPFCHQPFSHQLSSMALFVRGGASTVWAGFFWEVVVTVLDWLACVR